MYREVSVVLLVLGFGGPSPLPPVRELPQADQQQQGGLQAGGSSPLHVRVSPQATHRQRLLAAQGLLNQSPLIDGHNDLAWNVRMFLHNKLHSFNLSSDLTQDKPWKTSPFSHTDLPRLKRGQVAAQFWSVYVPCESQYLNTVQLLLEQIDVVKRMIAANPRDTVLVRSSAGEATLPRYVSPYYFSPPPTCLPLSQRERWVWRCLSGLLCYFFQYFRSCPCRGRCANELPYVLVCKNSLHPSLLQELVREMNRVGLMVDVSHASPSTARDVLRASRAPVIFSHSAARALCDIERNVPDDILSSLAANGGILMVSFYNDFLTCSEAASIQDVVAHINHVRTMAGVDYVGLGAGYDGVNRTPQGLEDVSRYPELFAELLKDPTWSLQDLKKLAGLNLLRVLRRVEQVREELSGERPSEEIIPIHDIDSRWPCRYRFASLDHART
ncbi:dipeptidase 1-like [Panulirus ornatus]|uniref:dipeptidase 1-like n=1 Tax=Panulirus ornatus TaxID=150431 RepID=UPI003A8A1756